MSPSFWKQILVIMLFFLLINAYYAYRAQQGAQSAEIRIRRSSF